MRHMTFARARDEDIWFLEALEEHAQIVGCELTSDDTVRMCSKCKDPIRGVVCFNRLHQPSHWGCKQQCRLGEVCSFAIEEKQHTEMTSAQKSKPRRQQTFLRNVETQPADHLPLRNPQTRNRSVKIFAGLRKSYLILVANREMQLAGCQEQIL